MRMLIAVDGSAIAVRAARHAGRLALSMKQPPQLLLLHVDAPLMRAAAAEIGVRGVEKYHVENATFAMRGARAALKRLRVAFEEQALVGDGAQRIVESARAGKFDLVVMGSHGRGVFRSLFLGSVVTKVLSHSQVPVLVVR